MLRRIQEKMEPEAEIFIPKPINENNNYLVKIADNKTEIDAAYRLRYEVFNIELDEGLDTSFLLGIDQDEYDDQFLHLIVIDKSIQKVIATYRIQNYAMAQNGRGFYSASRFDFSAFPQEIQTRGLEVSRACIAKNYRSSKVFYLLWKGLALMLYENKLRYFFGCCSIPSRNPQDANGVVKLLQTMAVYHDKIFVHPLPNFECIFVNEETDITKVTLPALFNLYLRFKCRVCSAPCKDDEFKTITFLVVYDAQSVSDKHHSMFLGNRVRLF